MNKQLVIFVKDSFERVPSFERSKDENIYLYYPECRNIMKPFENVDISTDDLTNAIDLIITHMVRNNLSKIIVDIAECDRALVSQKKNDVERDRKGIGI